MAHYLNLETVNEDTIQCLIFSSSPNSDNTFWEKTCENINKTIGLLALDYIWHQDEFKVYIPIDNKEKADMPAHLISTTCFGDNLEDEWFIVYLIMEITKQYENLIVQVKDNDGEFILIEAADYLPSWANPDSTDNRVFIYQNHVHIIPLTVADADTELTLRDAINFVADLSEQTKALEIQQAVLKRIGNYPKSIKENTHRAIVHLPLETAALLTLKPSLIAALVSMYCNHDALDTKACSDIAYDIDHCVTIQVKFTKCLYAMLLHSKLIKSVEQKLLNERQKKNILGLKITCGYKMIMNKLSDDPFSTSEYTKFVKILDESGYFQESIQGSHKYKRLLEKAKDFFLGMVCSTHSHVSNTISQILSTNEYNKIKNSIKNNVSETDLVEDNEDWLNIRPEQLNDLLNTRYGQQSNFRNDDTITPQTITSELSNFLKQTSDFEGIEPNDDEESDEENIVFDSDEFVNSLKHMLNLISSGNEDMQSNFSDDYDDVDEEQGENEDLDKELKANLQTAENDSSQNSKTILLNMIQSLKEEKGSTGPSSNMLRTIGINKTDLLDSDDD